MTMQVLAEQLRDYLAPACVRIEIAGSIRRGKADPKDIELVAIARVEPGFVHTLFGSRATQEDVSVLEAALEDLYAAGEWQLDPTLKRNGPKYKRLRHTASGACCDLFITSLECWGVIFTIRTGPGDFSKELVTRARRVSMVVEDGQLWRTHRDGTKSVIPVTGEREFFMALGVRYREPHDRTLPL